MATFRKRANSWQARVQLSGSADQSKSFKSYAEAVAWARKIYSTREEAKSEVFEYIEVFYNRKRRHSHLNQLSPMVFEKLQNGS